MKIESKVFTLILPAGNIKYLPVKGKKENLNRIAAEKARKLGGEII